MLQTTNRKTARDRARSEPHPCGHAKVEHEQSHGDGEDAIARGCQTLYAVSGNAVVNRMHRRESSRLQARRQKPEPSVSEKFARVRFSPFREANARKGDPEEKDDSA